MLVDDFKYVVKYELNLFLRDTFGTAIVSLVEPTTTVQCEFSSDSGENASDQRSELLRKRHDLTSKIDFSS